MSLNCTFPIPSQLSHTIADYHTFRYSFRVHDPHCVTPDHKNCLAYCSAGFLYRSLLPVARGNSGVACHVTVGSADSPVTSQWPALARCGTPTGTQTQQRQRSMPPRQRWGGRGTLHSATRHNMFDSLSFFYLLYEKPMPSGPSLFWFSKSYLQLGVLVGDLGRKTGPSQSLYTRI